MAQGSNYKVAFRRRREGKTDYAARFRMADLNKSRLVVRVSNANVIVQIINIRPEGDETIVSAHSKELRKLGWLGGSSNTSAVYLTGYLCGKKALNAGVENAILDIGLRSPIKGSKIFAGLKGAVDAGLEVPYGESVIPQEDRINGQSVADYAASLDEEELNKHFSQYLARGLQPVDLPNHFEEIKNKIDEAEV